MSEDNVINLISEGNVILEELENEARRRYAIYKKADLGLGTTKDKLREVVNSHEEEREKIQRKIWAEKDLGWCCSCEEHLPKKQIRFVYIECEESEFVEERTIKSLCVRHAEKLLSSRRKFKEKEQFFRARRKKDGSFTYFISGEWAPLSKPGRTKIQVEKSYVSEDEFEIGSFVQFRDSVPNQLIVGDDTLE